MNNFLSQIIKISSIWSFLGFLNFKYDTSSSRFTVSKCLLLRNVLIFPVIYFLKALIPQEILTKGYRDYDDVSASLTEFFIDIVRIFRANNTLTTVLLISIQFYKSKAVSTFMQTFFRCCIRKSSLKLSKKSHNSTKLFVVGICLNFVLEFLTLHKVSVYGLLSFLNTNLETVIILGHTVTVAGSLLVLESFLNSVNNDFKECVDLKASKAVMQSKFKGVLDFQRLMKTYAQSFGILVSAVTVFHVSNLIVKVGIELRTLSLHSKLSPLSGLSFCVWS